MSLPLAPLPSPSVPLAGKAKRKPVNADKPELWIALRGHQALEQLEECRNKGWADDSVKTVAAFKRNKLYSFKEHDDGREGGQLAWAVSFDPDAKTNKECQLSGTFSHGKADRTKGMLALGKAYVKRLGLNDFADISCSIKRTIYIKEGGVKGGDTCASWDEVFAEGAEHVEIELEHGVRILLTAREEEEEEEGAEEE